jgi:hypothetical protein
LLLGRLIAYVFYAQRNATSKASELHNSQANVSGPGRYTYRNVKKTVVTRNGSFLV